MGSFELTPPKRTFNEKALAEVLEQPEAAEVLGGFYKDGGLDYHLSEPTAEVINNLLQGFHVARAAREQAREEWRAEVQRGVDMLGEQLTNLETVRDHRTAQIESIREQLDESEFALALMKGEVDGSVRNKALRRASLTAGIEAVARRFGRDEAARLMLSALDRMAEGTEEDHLLALREQVADDHPDVAKSLGTVSLTDHERGALAALRTAIAAGALTSEAWDELYSSVREERRDEQRGDERVIDTADADFLDPDGA